MVKKFFEYHYNESNFENLREYFLNAIDNGFDLTSWEEPEVDIPNINLRKYTNLIYPRLTIKYDNKDYQMESVFKNLKELNLEILFLLPTNKDIYFIDYSRFFGMGILSQIEDSLNVKLIWINKDSINGYHHENKMILHINMLFGSEKN